VQKWKKPRRNQQGYDVAWMRGERRVATRHEGSHRTRSVPLPVRLDLSPFFSSVPFFFLDPLFLWANQAGREIWRGRLGGIKPGVALVTMRRTGPFPFCMLSFIFLFSFDSFPKQHKQERKEGAWGKPARGPWHRDQGLARSGRGNYVNWRRWWRQQRQRWQRLGLDQREQRKLK
jgi:hypothetical protein